MKSSYPVQVKVYLKATPSALMTAGLMVLMPVLMLHLQYFRMERLPKSVQKQTEFEKLLEYRDKKFRNVYHDYLTRQPKDLLNVKMLLD